MEVKNFDPQAHFDVKRPESSTYSLSLHLLLLTKRLKIQGWTWKD
jgi:hypothetical protein